MTMTISRAYDHRTFGRIGVVELIVPDTGWELNGNVLSARSIEYLATFALQSLQDAYAGAESADEAIVDFETKRDRVIDGTIGTRAAGVGGKTTVMRQLAKAAIKVHSPALFATFKGMDDAELNAILDTRIDEKREAYEAAFAEEMARRAAERAAKASIASAL